MSFSSDHDPSNDNVSHFTHAVHEAGEIIKIALWELDIGSMNLSLSKEGYRIFELNNPVKLSIDQFISFFEAQHRLTANDAIEKAINHTHSFDLELPFRTAKNNVIWVRFKGISITDEYGKCVSIHGILQDIDQYKKRELALQNSLSLATDRNKRLQNFAYIVSHNLRTHTGNLQSMVNMYNETKIEAESAEFFGHIQSISESLNTTVKHLEEVVKIQAEITNDKEIVEFKTLFKNLLRALSNNIDEANASIEYDFSRCTEIKYIPAYLESILQNLLTNALKYRQQARQAIIKCHTYIKSRHIYLVFEDNGLGIDMARYGDEVFGMYKTFHKNADSQGIGLFITRNQVESLGGSIKLESIVDKGTKFTIRLT
jgi:signal transduction histidine kinase